MKALIEELRGTGTVTFGVKVIPKSSKDEIAGELPDGRVKVKVSAAPDKGKANAAVCALLAKEIGVPRSHVEILSGHASPLKRIRVVR